MVAILFLITLTSTVAHAQQDTGSVAQIVVKDLKESVVDLGHYMIRPLHFDGQDLTLLGGTAAVTAISIETADQPTREFFQKRKSWLAEQVSSFGNFFGTGALGGVTAATLYTAGLVTHDRHIRLMGRHIVQCFAYSGVVTTGLKYLFGRERPYLNDGPKVFHGPSFNGDWTSLPSGHTTVATAICSALAADIDNRYASIGLYSIAATTVFARMYSDRHWLSDTFLGAVIGTTTGYWIAHEDIRNEKAEEASEHGMGYRIVPGLNNLSLVVTF